MRSFRLLAALAGVASVLPLLLLAQGPSDLRADEVVESAVFTAGLTIANLLPFALLIALAARLSAVARRLTLGLLVGLEALVAYDFMRSSDGQAGLIYLVLPFYLLTLVFLVWAGDSLVRAIRRRRAARALRRSSL